MTGPKTKTQLEFELEQAQKKIAELEETACKEKSQARYQSLFQNSYAVMLLIDPDTGQIMEANPAAAKFYGWTEAELCNKNINEINILTPDEIKAEMELARAANKNFFSFKHGLANGEIRDVEVYSGKIVIETHELLYSIIHDVTERKKIEMALRESEVRFSTIYRHSPVGIVITRLSDNIMLEANDIWLRHLEFTREEIVGKTALGLDIWVKPEDRAGMLAKLKNSEFVPYFETTLRKKSGDTLEVLVSAAEVIINSEPCMLSQFIDIAQHKQAENALIASEKKLRALVDSQTHYVVRTNLAGQYIYWNPKFEKEFGWIHQQNGIQNAYAMESIYEYHHERLLEVVKNCIAEPGRIFSVELDKPAQDGGVRTTLWDFICLTDENNEPNEIQCTGIEITDRKKTEEALRASNDINQAILNASTESVFLINANGKVVACNEMTAMRLGKHVEDLIGTSIYEHLPDEVAQTRMKRVEEVVRNGLPAIFEDERLGSWIENSIYPIRDANGEIRRLAIYGRDITERKVMETALQKSEALLTEAQRIGRIGHMEWIAPENTLICSDELYNILEIPRHELITQNTIASMMAPEERDRLREIDMRAIANQTDINYEYRIHLKNGQERWLHQQGKLSYDKNGMPLRMMAIIQDITERKHVEENLKAEQLRFTKVAAALPGAICTFLLRPDGTLYIPYASKAFEDIYGIPLSAVSENINPIVDRVPAEQVAQLVHDVGLSANTLQPWHNEYQYNHPTKGMIWIEGLSMPIKEVDGSILWHGFSTDITERKMADEVLRQNEARLKQAQQIARVGSWELDLQNNNLKWSDEIYRIFGMKPQEFKATYEAFLNAIHPEDREVVDKAYTNSLKTQRPYEIVHRLLMDDGSIKYVHEKCETEFDGNGTPLRSIGTVQDITERRFSEEALRASEEKYRGLMESLDSVIATMDATGRFLYMNDVAAKQLGGKASMLIGKTMHDLFPAEYAEQQLKAVQQVIYEDCATVFESQSYVNGQMRWYRTSIQPIHDESGNVAYALINTTDIDDLKTAQQELQELNYTLEQRVEQRTAEVQDLYNNAPAGYHSLDANGNIILVNQTELNWLGYSREDLMGKPIANILTSASLSIFHENFPAFKKRGWIRDLELEFIRRDGSVMPILVNGTAIYDEQGNYVMSRSTVLDNTDQKAAEETLRHANLELARAMRMKDEFLASMSHELRTPLTGILGLSEALQADVYGLLNERQKDTLANIESSGRHLLDLINDILDVSKIEAGKLELQMEPCSLGDICQSSIQLTKGMAGKKRQNVNFTMSPAAISIRGDARRLKQVLVNLLSNAVKFTPEEGRLGLEVTADEQENIVYISVWDQGIGISPEDLKKLFQPFVQLDSRLSRQQSGTGLGLALVQRLTELHGGSVQVKSTPNEGSRFTIMLPCLPSSTANSSEQAQQSKFHYALIIEDITADAEQLIRYSRALGIIPIQHNSGKGAFARTIETRPDVIFLDLGLPDISGWDILTQLKTSAETKHIPVIITSVDDEKQKAAELGADGYLVKFFTVSDLRAMLDQVQKSKKAKMPAPESSAFSTIMIVDDNVINISTLADFLRAQNFNVVSVASGVEFLSQAPQIMPDLVLMDIQMPEMDGLETTRRLRLFPDRRLASIPVIAITALAMPGDRERCIDAGADEYISKPFRLIEIQEIVHGMLEERRRNKLNN